MRAKPLIICFLLIVSVMAFASPQSEDQGSGKPVVRVFGAFRGEEAARFEEAIKGFEEKTGIDVIYEGSPEFETQIFVQVEAGTPPDVAALPQPGLMKKFAAKGQIKPLPAEVVSLIDSNYKPVWKELASYDGKVYGVFHRVNIKSLVWYPKKVFEKNGWKVPATWDELLKLSEEIAKAGYTPWSIGMESGNATGWVATDWVEDIMLRTAGPDVYDKWVNHKIPFNDPAVKNACEIMMQIWGDSRLTLGGPQNILTTNFGDAVLPLFENPPRAILHRQGNFITGFMPQEVQKNLDEEVGVFALPAINPAYGTPVLGGGDQFVMFNDRPEVREFLKFLTTWDSAKTWAQAGGAIFPYKNQNLDDYTSALERKMAEILINADVFRFDASDLMPAEVGAGSFWTGMADLVSGVPVDDVLSQIEESWPQK